MQKTEERRLVTILFADLSGFTRLSHSLDPEDVQEVANACFEYLNPPIIKQGGMIHKYEGDLVIALFGIPVSHEDDPERAIKAGLEMLTLIPEINNALTEKLKTKTDLGLHIGINSGTVVIGEVGSIEKKEWTVMGDVVNLASRLKDIAKRGEIIVSEPVCRSSRYLFDYEALPPVNLKGIEEPVKIFKPLKIKEKPEPKRGIAGLYSPLVGRDRELGLFKERIFDLQKGKSGAVFIIGDAGLGKSRLYEELKKSVTPSLYPSPPVGEEKVGGITVLEARCLSYGEMIPNWPFLQFLEQIFGITDSDSPEAIQKKLIKKAQQLFLNEGAEIWKEIVPYIGYLFSVRFPDELDEKIKYLDPQALRIQISVSVRKLLLTLARQGPIILVIEDYHWIDSASLELLEFIFNAFSPPLEKGGNLLFIGLSRIEKEKECWRTKERMKEKLGEDFLEITLNPLDDESSAQLAHNLLKIPGIPEEFRDRIVTRAGGNPFYLEEIIRSFIDSGILFFGKGMWKLSTPDSQLSTVLIPDTVQAVIASRLDHLESDVRDLLQMASVIGRNFYERVLAYLSGLDSLMLSLHLAVLEDLEFIRVHRREPELEYIFRHPLLQEVCYNALLKRRRRQLHQKIGSIIEEIFKERVDEFTELLAYQYSNSDDTDKAVFWLRKAGEKAKASYANDEALRYFERLIEICRAAGASYGLVLRESYETLGDTYNLKGMYNKATESYKMMAQEGDRIVGAKSLHKVADVYKNQGDYEGSLRSLFEAEKLVSGDSIEEKMERAEVLVLRCWIYRIKGEMERATIEGYECLKILDEISTLASAGQKIQCKKIAARTFNNLGVIFWNKGDYDKAIELFQKYLKISEEIGYKQGIGIASGNLGMVYYYKGDYDKAIELFQKDLKISEETGYKQGIGKASGNLGTVYCNKGEYDKAIELFQKDLKISEEIGDKLYISIASNNLGMVYYYKGEYDRATELFQKYLKISEETGDKQGIGIASGNLGGVFLEIGDFRRAKEYLANAEEVLKEIGDKFYLIEIFTKIADLQMQLRGKGWQKISNEYLTMAFNLAEEIGSKEGKATTMLIKARVETSFGVDELGSSGVKEREIEEKFKSAIKMFEELRQPFNIAKAYFYYGEFCKSCSVQFQLDEQDIVRLKTDGTKYLQKAKEIFEKLGIKVWLEKIKRIEDAM